jgi:hypothetical protein
LIIKYADFRAISGSPIRAAGGGTEVTASSTPHTPSNAKAPAAVKPGLTEALSCD